MLTDDDFVFFACLSGALDPILRKANDKCMCPWRPLPSCAIDRNKLVCIEDKRNQCRACATKNTARLLGQSWMIANGRAAK